MVHTSVNFPNIISFSQRSKFLFDMTSAGESNKSDKKGMNLHAEAIKNNK